MLDDYIHSDETLTISPREYYATMSRPLFLLVQEFVSRELPLQVVLTANS